MSTDFYRKCSKCGITPYQDETNGKLQTFHRFPRPGKTNILRAKAWATYCWPDQESWSLESLKKLFSSHKVLCKKHFEVSCFTDIKRTRLSKFSVPGEKHYVTQLMDSLRRKMKLEAEKNTLPPVEKIVEAEQASLCCNISATSQQQQACFDKMSAVKRRFCIFGCDALDAQGVPLHRFPDPEKQPDLFAAWMSAVGDKVERGVDPNRVQNRRICDHHFDPASKLPKGRLIWSAIPKINLKRVRQSISTILDTDHSYCQPRREYSQSVDLSDITESSGPSSVLEDVNLSSSSKSELSSQKAEEMIEAIFSWQKETDWLPTEIMADDDDDIICPSMGEAVELPGPGECSMYCDDEPATGKRRDETSTSTELKPVEYQCNECGNNIVGFRYTCVQCADWDLCGACEARTAHSTHYVLRVPSPRPYAEVQAVLKAIRQLLSVNPLSNGIWLDESLKLEVKEESAEEEESDGEEYASGPDPLASRNAHQEDALEEPLVEACGPSAAPDPLASWGPDPDSVLFENEEFATDADDPPPRKRARPSPSPADTEQLASLSPQHQQNAHTTISSCDTTTHENLTTALTDDNQIKTLAPNNQTKLAQNNQTTKLADDNSAKLPASIKRLIGINSQTGKLIYHQSRLYNNIPARSKCPQNKPVSLDLTLSQEDATTRLPTVGVDKPTTGHRTGRQTARLTSVDDPPSPADTREPNTPSVAAEEKRKGLVLKVPPGTDTQQLFRALKSKVTVRLERLQVEIKGYVPAKKKKTK